MYLIDPRRENKGGAGATRSRGVEGAERVGGPTQPSRSCGRRRGRERRGGGTYWGPSSRCSWGSPPADEGRGSPGRPGGPGRCRTGQWSRPWLRGTLFGHSPYLTTPCPPAPPPPLQPPPRSQKSFRHAGTGKQNRKLSAPSGPPPGHCACAGRPRCPGCSGPGHVTSGGQRGV